MTYRVMVPRTPAILCEIGGEEPRDESGDMERRKRRNISGGEVTERGTMGRTFLEGLS
jgi:hypothetical protein